MGLALAEFSELALRVAFKRSILADLPAIDDGLRSSVGYRKRRTRGADSR